MSGPRVRHATTIPRQRVTGFVVRVASHQTGSAPLEPKVADCAAVHTNMDTVSVLSGPQIVDDGGGLSASGAELREPSVQGSERARDRHTRNFCRNEFDLRRVALE